MRRVSLGVVGLRFGRHWIARLQSPPTSKLFELTAVCDHIHDLADDTANQFGVRAFYRLEDLLKDPSLDAVALFTAPKGRAGLVRQVIHAGKDVLTTKPFELDPKAALEVLHEAQSLGRVVHINSPSPLIPDDLRQIDEWVNTRDLGRPVAARFETWASYREQPDGTWYDDPLACPVAPIFRLGIYAINDFVHLFGPALNVQVMHSRLFTDRPTPDNAQLAITFQNGVIANVFASFCIDDGQPYKDSMVLNYERGTIHRDVEYVDAMHRGQVRLRLITAQPDLPPTEERSYIESISGTYQWDAFYRAVCGQQISETVSPQSVVAGIRIIEAMARAEMSGCLQAVQA